MSQKDESLDLSDYVKFTSSRNLNYDSELKPRLSQSDFVPMKSSSILQLLGKQLREDQPIVLKLSLWENFMAYDHVFCFLTADDGECSYSGFICKDDLALKFIDGEIKPFSYFQVQRHELKVYRDKLWVHIIDLRSTDVTSIDNGRLKTIIHIPLIDFFSDLPTDMELSVKTEVKEEGCKKNLKSESSTSSSQENRTSQINNQLNSSQEIETQQAQSHIHSQETTASIPFCEIKSEFNNQVELRNDGQEYQQVLSQNYSQNTRSPNISQEIEHQEEASQKTPSQEISSQIYSQEETEPQIDNQDIESQIDNQDIESGEISVELSSQEISSQIFTPEDEEEQGDQSVSQEIESQFISQVNESQEASLKIPSQEISSQILTPQDEEIESQESTLYIPVFNCDESQEIGSEAEQDMSQDLEIVFDSEPENEEIRDDVFENDHEMEDFEVELGESNEANDQLSN